MKRVRRKSQSNGENTATPDVAEPINCENNLLPLRDAKAHQYDKNPQYGSPEKRGLQSGLEPGQRLRSR